VSCSAPSRDTFLFIILIAFLSFTGHAQESGDTPPPRILYNQGTQKLADGKLTDAETGLQAALAGQDERTRPFALYNLGETRFSLGADELKKGPSSKAAVNKSQQANDNAADAINAANAALAGDDVSAIASAYMQGRGARKDLKSAMAAVKSALDTYGNVLNKWNRSAGDFKSANELDSTDSDAKANADIVDRCIAKLVDKQQQMMQMMQALGKQKQKLDGLMAAMKMKMPGSPGGDSKGKGDDDDEDEDGPPKGPKDGQEPGTKIGREMVLSREEAAQLLDMLKLDANRKLGMGMEDTAKPKDRHGRDW
jgi:tetratricopeptide (TPR) repeat protein